MAYTILLIEDDDAHRDALEAELVSMGHRVIAAASGMSAPREVEKETVHLVIADLYLPGGPHGLSVADMIRHRFNIPAIFMTAHREVTDAIDYPLPGTVFNKPVDLAALRAEMTRVLPADLRPPRPLSDTPEEIQRGRMKRKSCAVDEPPTRFRPRSRGVPCCWEADGQISCYRSRG